MNKEEILKNRIFEVKSGSHLYGTNTPESDIDHVGIFIPNKDYYFGLKNIEQTNIGIIDKHESGKNTKDAFDRNFYAIKKFFNLAIKNNPNTLELFFTGKENVIYSDSFAQRILDNYNLFLSKKLIKSFLGYCQSQKHKMVIRTDKWHDLTNAYNLLVELQDKIYIFEVAESYPLLFVDYKNKSTDHNKGRKMVQIGDLSFPGVQEVKYVRERIKKRLDMYGNRKDIIIKHGFDTKFASHLIRLLLEGKELVETGKLEFPLKDRKLILDVKMNKYPLKEIVEMSDDFEADFKKSADKTCLQEKPAIKEIEKLLVGITQDYLEWDRG